MVRRRQPPASAQFAGDQGKDQGAQLACSDPQVFAESPLKGACEQYQFLLKTESINCRNPHSVGGATQTFALRTNDSTHVNSG